MFSVEKTNGMAPFWMKGSFFLFLVSTLLIPVAPVNKFFFGFLIIGLFFSIVRTNGRVIFSRVPLAVLLIHIYGFLISVFNHVDIAISTQLLFATLTLLLIYVVVEFDVPLDAQIKWGSMAVCIYTGMAYVLIFSGNEGALELFKKYSSVAAGERAFAEESLEMFHIGAAPFLFLPYCLFLKDLLDKFSFWKALAFFAIIAAIVISTSRGLMVTALVATVYMVVAFSHKRARKWWILGMVVLFPILIWSAVEIGAFNAEEQSNAIKVGHAKSFLDSLTATNIIFGNGLGAYYYSIGRDAWIPQTEITPFDSVRYFGLPISMVLYVLILFPTGRWRRYLNVKGLPFVLMSLYIILATTNPVLFNSYGLIVVLWYWSKILPSPIGASRMKGGHT